MGIRMSTTIDCPIPGVSQPIQLDENNNFIDPVTGELMHQLTVEEMPRHTFGAELYAQAKKQSFKLDAAAKTTKGDIQ